MAVINMPPLAEVIDDHPHANAAPAPEQRASISRPYASQ
jgi:hypothetical protein